MNEISVLIKNKDSIGKNIKLVREYRNMLISDLTKLLPLSEEEISDLEAGLNPISAKNMFELAEVLNISVSWIICNDDINLLDEYEPINLESLYKVSGFSSSTYGETVDKKEVWISLTESHLCIDIDEKAVYSERFPLDKVPFDVDKYLDLEQLIELLKSRLKVMVIK